LSARKHLKCKRQQCIASENGSRFIECDVNGGSPSTQLIIVHCGKVVMDEGVAMHQLDRCCSRKCLVARQSEQASTFQHKEWSESLSAAEHCVTHDISKPAWNLRRQRIQDMLQPILDCFCIGTELLREGHADAIKERFTSRDRAWCRRVQATL